MNDKLIITKFLSRNYPIGHPNINVCMTMGKNGKLIGRELISIDIRESLGYSYTNKLLDIIDEYINDLINK